jgi:hypothetical protein
MNEAGFRVLRYWDNLVLGGNRSCARRHMAGAGTDDLPPPQPSPARGGGSDIATRGC